MGINWITYTSLHSVAHTYWKNADWNISVIYIGLLHHEYVLIGLILNLVTISILQLYNCTLIHKQTTTYECNTFKRQLTYE